MGCQSEGGDLAPGGQEGPAGAAGAQAGARDGVDHNSEPRRGDSIRNELS